MTCLLLPNSCYISVSYNTKPNRVITDLFHDWQTGRFSRHGPAGDCALMFVTQCWSSTVLEGMHASERLSSDLSICALCKFELITHSSVCCCCTAVVVVPRLRHLHLSQLANVQTGHCSRRLTAAALLT